MSGTYATGKPYPPRSEWVPRIFRREGMFYIVELAEDDDLAVHARLNPGTQRIEDIYGNQLWPPPLASADIRPEGGDSTEIEAPFTGGPVGSEASETPNPQHVDEADAPNVSRNLSPSNSRKV